MPKLSRVMFSSASDDWSTPSDVYSALNEEFRFNYDPCPIKGKLNWSDCGIHKSWSGKTCFVNPPYSEVNTWVAKGFGSARDEGATVVMLLPSRTDTRWFHEYCTQGEIRFIKGRLKFGNSKNSAPFPSMIVIFKPQICQS